MRDLGAAAAALLLIASICVVNAQLIGPKGTEVSSDSFVFSFQHEITIFGETFANDKKHCVHRKSGRVTLGKDTCESDFNLLQRRLHSILHPSEIFTANTAGAPQFWQGRLNDAQLQTIRDIIRANFWGADFVPLGGHLFTWDGQRHVESPEKTSIFQAAVIYNERSTYALYNYVAMNFTDAAVAAKPMVGFSKRGSFETSLLPFTGPTAGKLPGLSGLSNGTLGRFIYRIDSWPPRRGGCLSEDPASPADRILSTTMSQDSVLGGGLVIVSGRCHEPGAGGTCYVTMGGERIGESQTVNCTGCGNAFLACRVPPSYREGSATISLKMNTQETDYSTNFMFVNPDEPSLRGITLIPAEQENWMKLSSQGLQISFNPAGRDDWKLRVIGYSESGLSQINAANSPMKVLLEVPAPASGQMDLSSLSCTVAECDTHHIGFLEIVDNSAPPNFLRSRIIPLGWFVHKYYTDKQQPQWYRERCRSLSDTDAQTQKVREQLLKLACPATLAQAKADADRFLRRTYCPELPAGCASATPKQQCFVSRPETNADTHGTPASVCCYDDAKGHMLYQELLGAGSEAAWSQHGSTALRSHPDGQPHSASILPGQVSFMSNWYWDTLKFLYCCRWSSVGDCPFYFMHERPTPRSSAFAAGRGGSIVGDPHVTSFNGQPFLFNGYGEYWLLRTDEFQVQGRYIKLPSINDATFMVALAVKVGTGPAFEASVLPTGSNPRFQVLRRPADSDATSTEIRISTDYPYKESGVTIKLISASNIVIQLSSNARSIGVDLYAADDFDFMNAFISVSDALKNQSRGLLGRWTDNPAGGFVDIDGNVAEFRSNASEFDAAFCDKNRLKIVNDSLFNYDGTRASGFYDINTHHRNLFVPVFTADRINPHGEEPTVCQSDQNCVFDIRVTQNVQIATLTASHDREFGLMQASSNSSGIYCDKPNIRGIQIGADAILSEGGTLSVSCAAPLRSSKAGEAIQCRRQGDGTLKWEPDPATSGFECQLNAVDPVPASAANVGLIVGITVPVAVLIIVAVIIVAILLRRRSSSAGGGSGRPTPKPQQQQQQQQQKQLQTSRTTIVSADSDRGYDNQGHANRRMTPRAAAADGGDGNGGGAAAAPASTMPKDPQDDPMRRSYDQAQMEPMEPDEFNPDQYATPQKPNIGRSEVV